MTTLPNGKPIDMDMLEAAHEATLNVEGGTWYAYDGSFWYPISLPSHGIFGLLSDTFQQYFQGYGAVSGADTFPAS
jgi:hypothetical protein